MGKTGTSTLQRTFSSHRSVLADAGILYPRSESDRLAHHQLLMALVADPDRLPREFGDMQNWSEEQVRTSGEAMWQAIGRQVDETRPRTVVLSYESLLYLEPDQIRALGEILATVFTEIDVVAYVRHPSTHWLAVTQQKVKGTHLINPPGRYRVDLVTHLENYRSVFPGRVRVSAYDRMALHKGCIVADFFQRHLPEHTDVMEGITVKNVNESMSAEAMCVLQRLWLRERPGENLADPPGSRRILGALGRLADRQPQTKPRIDDGIQADLTARHQPALDWLVQEYDLDFPSVSVDPHASATPETLASTDLVELLDVDPDRVEQLIFDLIVELAGDPGTGGGSEARDESRWLGRARRVAGLS